jgi:glycosyltransferase involved in cell wall biosynthesis
MAMQGHDVTLIVADGQGEDALDGVRIFDVGKQSSRLRRVVRSTRQVFEHAVKVNADIYVLHDPELIPYGLQLKRCGRKVVFDSHEDVPTQVQGKPYLGRGSAWLIARGYQAYEQYACRKFDGVVGATPLIRDKLSAVSHRTIDVNNFPIIDEFDQTRNWSDKAFQVCYVGNITAMRGIRELMSACTCLRSAAKLALGGTFDGPELAAEAAHHAGWHRVTALGHLDRRGVRDIMAQSMAGLVTLHPQKNYLDALPVKMFEYMAAGIPVIASNFPQWRDIIEGNACGICVDPLRPVAIAEAIDYLITRPDEAQWMGANGRRAVEKKYNWRTEAQKMLNFYNGL